MSPLTCALVLLLVNLVNISRAEDFPFMMPTPIFGCPSSFVDALKVRVDAIRWGYNAHPLKLSDQITLNAQYWANQLLGHSEPDQNPHIPYGQAIYMGRVSGVQSQMTVDLERDVLHMGEARYYNSFGGEPASGVDVEVTKNFAQLVWDEAREYGLGCSAAHIGGETVLYVVIYFDVKGLTLGRYKYNVFPKFSVTTFWPPLYGCPDLFQQNFLRRINADRLKRLNDAPPVRLNMTLRSIAQLEADRLSELNQGLAPVKLSKEYGTLTYMREGNGGIDIFPRYPLWSWQRKNMTPEYLHNDGSVGQYCGVKLAKPMEMGIGCTTECRGDKETLYIVFLFAETVEEVCPIPTPVPTTCRPTTTTPRPTTTTPRPTTTTPRPTTTTPRPTTTTPRPTTTTPRPTTTTPRPTTTTPRPSTTTPRPTTTTPRPTTTTPKPTTTTPEPSTTTPRPTTTTPRLTTTTPRPTTTTPRPTTTTPKPTTTTPEPSTTTPKPTTTTPEQTTTAPEQTTTTPKPTTTTTVPSTTTEDPFATDKPAPTEIYPSPPTF